MEPPKFLYMSKAGIKVPQHIAIIMDGNGRWARKRKLPRFEGHRRGVQRIDEVLLLFKKCKIKQLTVFAFSTENWQRPKKEIKAIFSYFEYYLEKKKEQLIKEDIRLRVFGRRDRINKNLIKKIEEVESLTAKCSQLYFNIAFDYGGRWEIVNVIKKVINDLKAGDIKYNQIKEGRINNYFSLSKLEPDLLIRTSGEHRISNFLLWQLAYSELYFSKVLWPDFSEKDLAEALDDYKTRKRRFGKVK
jgi:undecaprenyl diphosphate synthase